MPAAAAAATTSTWRATLGTRSSCSLGWVYFYAFPELSGAKDVQFYLWGTSIKEPASGVWHRLKAARRTLENRGGLPTEPDIILRAPGKMLILVEAKFGSGNSTPQGKKDRFGDVDEFLERYFCPPHREDALNRRGFESRQLRMCLSSFAAMWSSQRTSLKRARRWLSSTSCEETPRWTVEMRLKNHLSERSPARFRRMTWEDFWPVLAHAGSEAEHLRSYLANRTRRLELAFPSLRQT